MTDDAATLGPPEYATVAGALVAIVGTVLPWQIAADSVTVGLEANGFLAILAAFGVLAVVAVMQGTRTSGRVAVGGGLLITLVAGHWIGLVSGLATAGIGVYATLLGGLAVLGGGVQRVRER